MRRSVEQFTDAALLPEGPLQQTGRDAGKAERVASALRHGTIWINDYHPYLPQAEWGGFKQSGVGRELGPTGLHEYLEAKHVYRNLSPAPSGWFSQEA